MLGRFHHSPDRLRGQSAAIGSNTAGRDLNDGASSYEGLGRVGGAWVEGRRGTRAAPYEGRSRVDAGCRPVWQPAPASRRAGVGMAPGPSSAFSYGYLWERPRRRSVELRGLGACGGGSGREGSVTGSPGTRRSGPVIPGTPRVQSPDRVPSFSGILSCCRRQTGSRAGIRCP
jgi:hypothetical protein